MAILLTSLFVLLSHSLVTMTRSEQTEQAAQLAREQIEKIQSRNVPYQLGTFDGRLATPQVAGFPPPPYPSSEVGGGFDLVVSSEILDERLLHLKVDVYQDNRVAAQITTVLKR